MAGLRGSMSMRPASARSAATYPPVLRRKQVRRWASSVPGLTVTLWVAPISTQPFSWRKAGMSSRQVHRMTVRVLRPPKSSSTASGARFATSKRARSGTVNSVLGPSCRMAASTGFILCASSYSLPSAAATLRAGPTGCRPPRPCSGHAPPHRFATVTTPGPLTISDGKGLCLVVEPTGTCSWVQRIAIRGRGRDIGLGSVRLVPLAETRENASINRKLARDGGDPLGRSSPRQAHPRLCRDRRTRTAVRRSRRQDGRSGRGRRPKGAQPRLFGCRPGSATSRQTGPSCWISRRVASQATATVARAMPSMECAEPVSRKQTDVRTFHRIEICTLYGPYASRHYG